MIPIPIEQITSPSIAPFDAKTTTRGVSFVGLGDDEGDPLRTIWQGHVLIEAKEEEFGILVSEAEGGEDVFNYDAVSTASTFSIRPDFY
jgi:hypothetical protein